MNATVGCLLEFWEKVSEERVDLGVLMNISARLFPLKKDIEGRWKDHINNISFTSWSILRTYSMYRRMILNDTTNARILDDYCQVMEGRLKEKNELTYSKTEDTQSTKKRRRA